MWLDHWVQTYSPYIGKSFKHNNRTLCPINIDRTVPECDDRAVHQLPVSGAGVLGEDLDQLEYKYPWLPN